MLKINWESIKEKLYYEYFFPFVSCVVSFTNNSLTTGDSCLLALIRLQRFSCKCHLDKISLSPPTQERLPIFLGTLNLLTSSAKLLPSL